MTTRRNKKVAESKAYHFNPVCAGKRFFKTEEAALEAADIRMLEYMSVAIGVYQCPTCMQWHLTSIRPDKKA